MADFTIDYQMIRAIDYRAIDDSGHIWFGP